LKDGILRSPSPEVREILMDFTGGDTGATELTPEQRVYILGQCTNLNMLHWAVSLASSTSPGHQTPRPREHPGRQWENTYTFSQPLPNLEEVHALPRGYTPEPHDSRGTEAPPNPIPWTPRFLLEECVYTDGSYIKGHPRLGAAVVHIPACTTIYIEAAGSEEIRTIMRAELVVIHAALSRFEDHPWIGVFTDSLSSLQAIRLQYYRPVLTTSLHYHHHMLLLQSISNLLEDRREKGFSTTLRKIRAHTHIRGNDLADATAKLAVTDFDTLPLDQTLRVWKSGR
jgi:ribonuclease HI